MTMKKVSEAEWHVMKTLWDEAPLTGNEVVERLERKHGWSPRTIKTMLNRLVKKRVLSYEHQGRAYLYHPAVTEKECVRQESRRFIDQLFGGRTTPMLAHFIEEAVFSQEEIEHLRSLLDKKDEGKNESYP